MGIHRFMWSVSTNIYLKNDNPKTRTGGAVGPKNVVSQFQALILTLGDALCRFGESMYGFHGDKTSQALPRGPHGRRRDPEKTQRWQRWLWEQQISWLENAKR